MRISELSQRSGVSVATIKYYLREGLLPQGTPLSPRDAEYHDQHLERLEIIRNLREIAHLSIETIKRLVRATDDPALPVPAMVGLAHSAALPSPSDPPPDSDALGLAAQFYGELGWTMPPHHPLFAQTAQLLSLLQKHGAPHTAAGLQSYVQAVTPLSRMELGLARSENRLLLVHDVVVGTYLGNQLLLTLHMAAQVDQAMSQFRERE